MKLKEIFESTMGRGIDRSTESNWRDQMARQSAARANTQTSTGASATSGIWLVSREGKKLAGPFSDEAKAEAYKTGRPDRIPANAVVKSM
jgi:hypothetical protein